jgi:hypothetical protein
MFLKLYKSRVRKKKSVALTTLKSYKKRYHQDNNLKN